MSETKERIMTLHPAGKAGVNISRSKYGAVRSAIVDALGTRGELTFNGLLEQVRCSLKDEFEGSINWYVTTVKLDLEARQIIERCPSSRPRRLRLAGR